VWSGYVLTAVWRSILFRLLWRIHPLMQAVGGLLAPIRLCPAGYKLVAQVVVFSNW